MTIEIRQMLIRSQVSSPQPQRPPQAGLTDKDAERLRRELLAECKAWLAQKLQEERER
jgi:hypothetical protein